MPKQVIKHQCNFCIKSWVSKRRAEFHEANCFRNPAVKSCFTCVHATKGNSEEPPWCESLQKEIYLHGNPIYDCSNWNEFEEENLWDD